jgi:hypothetical protein
MDETDQIELEGDEARPPVDPDAGAGADPAMPVAIVDQIRGDRSRTNQDRRLDLDIPGRNGVLVARYRPLEWDELDTILKKFSRRTDPLSQIHQSCDILCHAITDVLYRDPDGKLAPVSDVLPDAELDEFGITRGEPIGYDARLAKLLGIDATDASGIVRARRVVIEAMLGSEAAVVAHQFELSSWTANPDSDGATPF